MMRYGLWTVAILIVTIHVVVSFLLTIRASGVIFRTYDRVAVVVLGVIVAGALLLLTRARVRAGESGVSVRNALGDRLIPWSQVVGVSFPPGKRWARLELPDDEYIPLVAIQSADKEHAVEAMRALRALVARYRPPGEQT
ncbi:membrane protein [Mycolicibacter heraklionensis]|uniref:Membrane protein n=1 Tax=Mycolicibacter heraklionensis TaxID=512402 RepID=A0A9X7WD00_9MYCO|nr:PH domain-containing protein [Mycolicibacter heraklionensis]KLO31042.1 membrane protein [Mycolicibacter heraklionensis]QZA05955.1 PH domain-containing protein [Mycolicibacter heraklionensis]